MSPLCRPLLPLALVVLAGCQDAGLAKVSGTITLDGQPLAGATISLQPSAALAPSIGFYGQTDAEGKFVLRRVSDDAEGAAAGEHIVSISKSIDADPGHDATPPLEQVPARYRDGGVKFTVPPEGTDEANFALTSK